MSIERVLMGKKGALRAKLNLLREDHRQLRAKIAEAETKEAADHCYIRKMRKQKLALKDEIMKIEAQIYPNIIA